ncbi:MAG: DUF234 domain-containing protein [Sulfurovum sp.]|nr:DUF234 domain-containing protein [Sulfurovum sp.]
MSKHPTLLQHFRSFTFQNNIRDIDKALEYFAVFGGTGWDVDVSKSLDELIEEKILRNYESIHQSMTRYTHNNPVYHKLLTLVAQGVEYEHDTFKKAKIGRDRGEEAIDYLEKKSLLRFDFSVEKPLKEGEGKSDRLLFSLPFMRFWFAMVSPNYKSIAEGDFTEFKQKWVKLRENFSILLSNLLVRELILQQLAPKFADDPIVSIGNYYDKQTYIEVLAKRKSGKMLAGACKYAKEPAKINMPDTLKQKCKTAELNIEEYVLFSKNGFSAEVVDSQGVDTTLLSQEHLPSLLDNLTEEDLLVYKNKKY